MKNIIFVCTGNTCRSPMAEAIAKKIFNCNDVNVTSAGLSVYLPLPASENAVEALKKYDIFINDHISKRITEEDIKNADLIITMAKSHKQYLLSHYPKYRDKIYTLYEYSQNIDKDVDDPYGCDLETYKKCCSEIYDCIKEIKL